MSKRRTPWLVLTGGPCGGKTTALPYLVEKLADIGFYPIVVPESATLLNGGRVTPSGALFSVENFQRRMLSLTYALEDAFGKAAEGIDHPKPVLICDRGLMDAEAYIGQPEDFRKWLNEEVGMHPVQARDGRYDAVFHLRTAALGAESFYTLENNATRYETPEEARRRDDLILASWVGHPYLRIIPNEGSFERKLKHLFAACCRALAVPAPVEIERKFLVSADFDPSDFGMSQCIEVEQFYLITPDPKLELRLRRRGQYGVFNYFETCKRATNDPLIRVETERFITEEEYEDGKKLRDPKTRIIRKTRRCFPYQNQYFELDVFEDPKLKGALLEIELTDRNDQVRFPPFLRVLEEVTGNSSYSNHALAFPS